MTTDDLGDLAPLAAELAQALAPGIQLGGLLGRGGMGAVFLGRDPALKRSVVIKVLSPDLAHDEVARRRFAREAESAAAVAHPHVVAVHLVGELPRSGTSYFVMQHVDGVTLADACPDGVKVPAARCARIVGEVASALAAAHARGLVHRDIKPANIMLERGSERAIVLDFGISAALRPSSGLPGDTKLTQQGMSLGTPHYMSPEQAAGDEVTGQSDVYSLGVVAFGMLAGRAPFEATSPMALAAAHIKDPPPDLMALRPDLDPALGALVARMLAKPAAARPTADEVARALMPASHATIEWPPPGLERMRGELHKALHWLRGAVLAQFVFFVVLALQPALQPMPFVVLAALTGFAVIAVYLAGVLGVAAAGNRIGWARLSGYPFGLATDLALDPFPDTGDMLNVAGRWAAIPPGGGWALLRWRRWAAGAEVAGVVLSSVVVFLWAIGWIGLTAGTIHPIAARAVLVLLLPAVLGWLAAAALRTRERRLRHRFSPREKIQFGWMRVAPVPGELVGGWLRSAAVEPPPARSRVWLMVQRQTFEGPVAVAVLLVEAAVAGVVMGAVFLPRPPAQDGPERGRWNEALAAQHATGGFAALDSALGRMAIPAGAAADTTAARELAAVARQSGGAVSPPELWRAFAALPGRLPDSLPREIEAMAAGSTGKLFARVAASGPLAPGWYAPGRRLAQDSAAALASSLNALSLAAVRHAAGAALALSAGNRSMAERSAREILAVGRQLWRDPAGGAAGTGQGMVLLGARTLRAVALATGNGALAREADSAAALVETRRSQQARLVSYRVARFMAVPGDLSAEALAGERDLAPSDRWQALAAIVMGVCWDPVEIRRGVSPARRDQLDRAARAAADIPRTGEWVASLREELDRLDQVRLISDKPLPWTMGFVKPAIRASACGNVGQDGP